MDTFIREYMLSDPSICDALVELFKKAVAANLVLPGVVGPNVVDPKWKRSTDLGIGVAEKHWDLREFRFDAYMQEVSGFLNRYIEELLSHGIHIYEHQKTLLHQKTMVVDGEWSLVGSTNLDDRSLDINDEASVGLIDPKVAATLRAAFENDLASCRELQLASWRDRGLWHRAVDRVSYMINEQL